MNFYCDKCGELLANLICTNTNYNSTGENCPLHGIQQVWQEMLVQKPKEVESTDG